MLFSLATSENNWNPLPFYNSSFSSKRRKDLEDAQTQLRGALVNAVSSRATLAALSSSSPSSSQSGSFVLRRKGPVGEGGSRLVEFCRRENLIVVSRQQNNLLFPGFGVQMIQPDFSQQKYVQLHTKAIKVVDPT